MITVDVTYRFCQPSDSKGCNCDALGRTIDFKTQGKGYGVAIAVHMWCVTVQLCCCKNQCSHAQMGSHRDNSGKCFLAIAFDVNVDEAIKIYWCGCASYG